MSFHAPYQKDVDWSDPEVILQSIQWLSFRIGLAISSGKRASKMARPLDSATPKCRYKNLWNVLGENAVDYYLHSLAALLSITRVRIEVHRLQGLAPDPVRKFCNGFSGSPRIFHEHCPEKPLPSAFSLVRSYREAVESR